MTRTVERVSLQPAYVLHSRPYRETSVLLELFSAEYGRVALVARGVRGKKSTLAALLQPFRPLLVTWQGAGGLGNLCDVESSGRAHMLSGTALMSGFYLNELLLRLLSKHDPQLSLFSRYDLTLRRFAELDYTQSCSVVMLENLLRQFERNLVDAAGYGLQLEHEANTGEALVPDVQYYYVLEQGPLREKPTSAPAIEILGATLLALDSGASLVGEGLREAKHLMRRVLSSYLGDRPLHSRELMRQVKVENSVSV